LIFLSGLMVWTGFPFCLVFALHRPAFDRMAVLYYEKLPMNPVPPPPRRVGLYTIESVRADPHGVTVYTHDWVALRYDADAPPSQAWYDRWLMGKWSASRNFESDAVRHPFEFVQYKLWQLLH
jgi:hypothetical protein